jgi:hypothetical protein
MEPIWKKTREWPADWKPRLQPEPFKADRAFSEAIDETREALADVVKVPQSSITPYKATGTTTRGHVTMWSAQPIADPEPLSRSTVTMEEIREVAEYYYQNLAEEPMPTEPDPIPPRPVPYQKPDPRDVGADPFYVIDWAEYDKRAEEVKEWDAKYAPKDEYAPADLPETPEAKAEPFPPAFIEKSDMAFRESLHREQARKAETHPTYQVELPELLKNMAENAANNDARELSEVLAQHEATVPNVVVHLTDAQRDVLRSAVRKVRDLDSVYADQYLQCTQTRLQIRQAIKQLDDIVCWTCYE